ncbi:CHRD domain-containing protein [Nocardia sp.]|uniref:CHRD domain-containing protein n=1 Tax=Nocardia sp. TaxID=1821 RepID=UPI002626B990|nr:CHRD domain-containing protein [Nocardia sp.]
MHIHPGSCADQTQPPSVPFPDITADTTGAVRQSVVSEPVPGGIPGGSYLNIHLAPSAQLGASTDVSFTPIGCADIPAGTSAAGPVTVKVAAPQKNGAAPAGTVKLAYDGAQHSLQVVLNASGLPAGSAHAVHIHSGSCAAQGAVLYPLPDLQANDAGDASLTATVDNVATAPPATGWYVNVHMGAMSQILDAAGNPTLLFAPILCADVTS